MQHLQPNTTLQGGKYRIEGVLGQGGFGITYMAENVYTHKHVAIKELYIAKEGQVINSRQGNSVTLTSYAYQGTFSKHKEKFKKEAYRLSTLRHPNIVNVYECFEENGTAYYVMDLIVGESLQSKLKREGALPEKLVSSYLNQLLSALMVVHEKNIWHLDIKPANIMVDKYGHIYLIDFGASKHIEQNYGSLTTSSMMLGSQGFCPPEQCDNAMQHIGAWTDIYALGATLYALLTNRNPPSLNAIISGGINAFVFPNTVSQKMRELVIWMMKVNRNERPQDIKSIIDGPSEDETTTIIPKQQPQTSTQIHTPSTTDNNDKSSSIKWIFGIFILIGIVIIAIISRFSWGSSGKGVNGYSNGAVSYVSDIGADTAHSNNETVSQFDRTNTSTRNDDNAATSQELKTSSITEKYCGKKYNYSIQVENGTLTWSFSGTGASESEKLSCNPQVSSDVIIAEFKGLAYWDIANELIFHMVEEQGFYSYDLYESAKDALGKCVSSFAKARSDCPNAFSKANKIYNDLINAENGGADALWEELTVLSYALGEHPISVCDIY